MRRIVRFLISGGIAAGIQVGGIYVLHGIWGIWYILSSVGAFVCAVTANFLLQKYWTFKNTAASSVHKQSAMFLITNLIALAVNVALLYAFVGIFKINYIIGQIMSSGLIAIVSFFVYRYIFTETLSDIIIS
jgi:putative flippase GtrA